MVERKNRDPRLRWMKTPFIITTNSLPSVLEKPVKGHNETDISFKNRKYDHDAIMTRVKMTETFQTHPNSSPFPYTADELALFMHHLCQENEDQDDAQSDISSLNNEPMREERTDLRDERVLAGIRLEAPYFHNNRLYQNHLNNNSTSRKRSKI